MKTVIRIGSRESRLAVTQTELIKGQIEAHFPHIRVEIVTMKTTGDRILDRSLEQIGGKGLFVKELDQALRDGRIDLSVHSLKDMPMDIPEDLPILAYSKREDPRDVLIYPKGQKDLILGGVIGTSSKRRRLQLERLYPDCTFQGIRGNVQTRLRKLEEEGFCATVLAAAGLKRLGMESCIGRYFSCEEVIPAAGQGILAVQARAGEYQELGKLLNDPQSEAAAKAERAFVKALDGGCTSPVAAYAEIRESQCQLTGLYWRESDESWFVEKISGRVGEASTLGEKLADEMEKKYGKESPSGKVWLAGAGPGDASLLTLKVKKCMDEADVIIYDALISAEILSLIPDGKEWIYVGKRSGHHCVRQEEINQILLGEAKAGKKVLRLKGGDPFVFGRGAEEAECLEAEGIPFEVIPGVTSALAVPAYAGIPVTHRDYASSFHVITGHAKQGKKMELPYEALAKLNGTLIFLMGITAMGEICQGLIQAGMDENTPAAVLEKGTTSKQRRLVSTLCTLEKDAKAFQVQTPAIILVGKVCTLAEKFDWVSDLPLWGTQILTTRPRQNSSRLSVKLRELGAQVIEMPSITTRSIWPNDSLGTTLESIRHKEGEQWLVFTSPIGVQTFWKQMQMLKMDVRKVFLPQVKVAAIGSGTARELEQFGVFADVVPETFCASALGEAIAKAASPESRIVLLRAKQGSEELIPPLKSAGLMVEDVPIYETVCELQGILKETIEKMQAQGEIDLVTFTSASTVRGFVQALPEVDTAKIQAVCIGEQTAAEAKKYGMQVQISKEASVASMVSKILELAEN